MVNLRVRPLKIDFGTMNYRTIQDKKALVVSVQEHKKDKMRAHKWQSIQ